MGSMFDTGVRHTPNMYDTREPGLRTEMFREGARDQDNPEAMQDRRGITGDQRWSALSVQGREQLQDFSQSVLGQVGAEAAAQCSQLQPMQICPPVSVSPETRQTSIDNLLDVGQLAASMRSLYFRESDPLPDQDALMDASRKLKEREAERLRRLARQRGAKL